MRLSRRTLLKASLLPVVAEPFMRRLAAQDAPTPVIFAHGHGDHAALWLTTLWRFGSNGYPPERLLAINFTAPLARSNDAVEQPGRSSSDDQLRELSAAIEAMRERTGGARVALVGSSRGGYAIRNYVQSGGAAKVSHVVLCGVPNRGVFDWEANPGSEFNGRAPFLRRLNAGEADVAAGTAFMTLYSEGNDKYAQPDGRFVGRPGVPTGITTEGATLRGAANVGLGQLDHREVAFHPRAFREMYRFITGREPARLDIAPQPSVTLNGLVTGFLGSSPTNRPVAGATVEIFRVAPESGERQGAALHRKVTAADGAWGPLTVAPDAFLEFVLQVEGHPVTHIYRSPFPRSSNIVHLRPSRPFGDADKNAGAVVTMSRPRGYFGIPRDVVLLDGKQPAGVKSGVPTDSSATLRLPAGEVGRTVRALFNEERIAASAWPAAENHVAIAEFTY